MSASFRGNPYEIPTIAYDNPLNKPDSIQLLGTAQYWHRDKHTHKNQISSEIFRQVRHRSALTATSKSEDKIPVTR